MSNVHKNEVNKLGVLAEPSTHSKNMCHLDF